MTRWRILDQFRKRGPLKAELAVPGETGAEAFPLENMADPASLDLDKYWEVDWEMTLVNAATAKVKQRIDPQKFQIFDFYVNKEWAAEKVASLFHVSVDQVYLAKHRVTDAIKEEVRRLEQETT